MKQPGSIIISRTDSIGDVILTLPLATALKQHFPDAHIAFLGKEYTRPVIEACSSVDQFLLLDDFLSGEVLLAGKKPEVIIHVFPVASIASRAKALGIPVRIGTRSRLFHWLSCNRLISLSRKNSDLHEAQLNLKLLRGLDLPTVFSRGQAGTMFSMDRIASLPGDLAGLFDHSKKAVILHPKSQGSAREWRLDHFIRLIQLLDSNRFQIFISGTAKEEPMLAPLFEAVGDSVTNIAGLMDLATFISFIGNSDALVANSTGPLHIASALGKMAIGIYPPIRPMHPGRWAPIGPRSQYFVADRDCADCRSSPSSCSCMDLVTPVSIASALKNL
ncbi:MAG: lipopolysaccharide heptosyltransferase family protein [Sphingobacteriales bacterium]|nr:MAG: lipopolysaccharide heptosyltransferase family protein [Sphingobacteriales bacterium]